MSRTAGLKGAELPGRTERLLQRIVLERRFGMPRGELRDADLRDLGFGGHERVYEHVPSPWRVLGRILRRGEVSDDDVFIDFGCGMGPVVVEAAARYDFRRIIGIDVVPEFTELARRTVDRGRKRLRCQDVQIITGDVAEYEVPDDVTVVFMADPFRGRLFETVLGKLLASVDRTPRPLRVIYNMPVEGARLERTGRARLSRYGRRAFRPWSKTTALAMYEIAPPDAAPRSGERPPRPPRSSLVKASPGARTFRAPSPGGSSNGVSDGHRAGTAGRSSAASSVSASVSADGVPAARAAFEAHHCVLLPGLLHGPRLERVQRFVDGGDFATRLPSTKEAEIIMEQGKAPELLLFLTNDRDLFRVIRAMSGCGRVTRFDGVIERTTPGAGGEEWHGEIFGATSKVGMCIDLSTGTYAGGELEIRDRHSREVLHTAPRTKPGDALLVRLDASLQRRVKAVDGDSPRTVYAGQFKSDVQSTLARPSGASAPTTLPTASSIATSPPSSSSGS